MPRKTISDRIRLVRQDAGLTQKDFGVKLGISRSMVNALERGRFEPRIEILVKIKKKFETNYDYLLEGK